MKKLTGIQNRICFKEFSKNLEDTVLINSNPNYSLCCCETLCSGLWPGRGDGRGMPGDPGQFDPALAAGDITLNGLLSG